MKLPIHSILLAGATMIALAGCEKETAFRFNTEEGQLNCNALSVDYINRGTRASNVDTGDFMVHFINVQTGDTAKSYQYAALPEIISLPIGEYRANATYGEDKVAEWENPVYEGSSSFSIEKGMITDDVDPIECSLQNMKVAVDIVDETGMDIVDSDVQVTVKAGSQGELTYDSEHIDSIGFFRYDKNSNTIIAELSGTLDGTYTEGITRTYSDAGAGKSYRIRFHINRPDNVGDGDIQIGDGIKVNATISIKNENIVIDPGEPDAEEIIDDMRPTEEKPDDPGKDPEEDPNKDPGDEPGDDPQPSGETPKILFPEGSGIELNNPFEVSEDSKVEFDVISETGITGFIIDIESANLSPLLPGVGLDTHLDLVKPEELKEGLEGLGFPTGDNVKGQKEVHFNINEFIPLLGIYGAGDHKFIMTITDANGTTIATLWLRTK